MTDGQMDTDDLLLMCFGLFLTSTMNNESVKVRNTNVLSVQVAFDWPPAFLATITTLSCDWIRSYSLNCCSSHVNKTRTYVKATYSSSLK